MIGRLLSDLPPGPGNRFRPGLAVEVVFPEGDLSSAARDAVLSGENLIAVETTAGWMLAGFERAELIASDRWRLSGLLTGLSGTEDLSETGAQSGARIVMPDETLQRADLSENEIGAGLVWQARGPGALADAASETLTLSARALKPYRPGHLRMRKDIAGHMVLSWTRRTRHSADRWELADVPVLEESLLFRIQVWQAGTLLRSADTAETVWTYSVTDQASDLTPGTPVTFEVCQISARVGEGVPARLSVTV